MEAASPKEIPFSPSIVRSETIGMTRVGMSFDISFIYLRKEDYYNKTDIK